MLLKIFYLITLIFILFGFLAPKLKLLAFFQIVWLWIIMSFNTYGMDYPGNYFVYETTLVSDINFLGLGWAYRGLGVLFRLNGLSFQEMEALVVGISLLILLFLAYKTTNMPSFFISIFYIYPFIDSAIQRRFFPSMMFVLLAIYFCIMHRRFWFVKYAICIYIACGFHFTGLFFIPVFLIYYIKRKTLFVAVFFSTLAGLALANNLSSILSIFIPASKVEFYLGIAGVELWKGMVFIFQILIFIFLVYKIENHPVLESSVFREKSDDVIMKLNYFCALTLPALTFDMVFTRFLRVAFILNYGLLLSRFQSPYKAKTKVFYLFWAYIAYLFLWSFLNIFVLGNNSFDALVKPFFVNNLFFNYWGVPSEI